MHHFEKKEWTFVFALLFIFGFLLVLWNSQITGKVSTAGILTQTDYTPSETLKGEIKLKLEQQELIPLDAHVKIFLNDEEKYAKKFSEFVADSSQKVYGSCSYGDLKTRTTSLNRKGYGFAACRQTAPLVPIGDVNSDGIVNAYDIDYLAEYAFKNGPAPLIFETGDVDNDEDIDGSDVIYLVNYIYRNGPAPIGQPISVNEDCDPKDSDCGELGGGGSPEMNGELLFYYKFDETSGTKAIDSTGRYNGIVNGWKGYVYRGPGKSGSSYGFFNGANVYVEPAPTVDDTKAFTFEAWIKPGVLDWTQTVVEMGLKGSAHYLLLRLHGRTDDCLHILLFTGGGSRALGNLYELNSVSCGNYWLDRNWHHVAVTYENTTLRLYVDGIQEATRLTSGVIFPSNESVNCLDSGCVPTNATIGIGTDRFAQYPFKGYIDEVKYYNYAKTSFEGTTSYKPPVNPELIAYYKFDEGSGNIARDSSGNGFNGTINATPEWITGKTGNALKFSQSNSNYVEVSAASESKFKSENFTLQASIKLDTDPDLVSETGNLWPIIQKNSQYALRFDAFQDTYGNVKEYLGCILLPNRYVIVDNFDWQTGRWYDIKCSYNGKDIKLYVDGVLKKTQNINSPLVLSPTNINIGGYTSIDGSYQKFPGSIDEVKIYNFDTEKGIQTENTCTNSGGTCNPEPCNSLCGPEFVNLSSSCGSGNYCCMQNLYSCENWDNSYSVNLENLGITAPSTEGNHQVKIQLRDSVTANVLYENIQSFSVSASSSSSSSTSSSTSSTSSGSGDSPCISVWHCSEWSPCSDLGKQTRSCIDRNECGLKGIGRPAEERTCIPTKCIERWDCTEWSGCQDGVRTSICVDSNGCGTVERKPVSVESCELPEQIQTLPELIKARWGFLWILVPLFIVFGLAFLIIAFLTKKEKEYLKQEKELGKKAEQKPEKEEKIKKFEEPKKPQQIGEKQKPRLALKKEVKYDKNVYVEPEVLRFVKDARARGVSTEVIRDQLIRVGWSKDVVEKALDSVK